MSTFLYLLPALQTAKPGDTIFVGLYVSSDRELTGLDYSLDVTGATLISRNLGPSSFPDLIDNSLTGDLGASIQDVRFPLAAGDHFVSTFEFRVDFAAHQALIKPKAFPGTTGYVLGPPSFNEFPFDRYESATVNVIPEPCALLLLAILGLLLRPAVQRFRQRCAG